MVLGRSRRAGRQPVGATGGSTGSPPRAESRGRSPLLVDMRRRKRLVCKALQFFIVPGTMNAADAEQ